jgi:hypothetical protein
MFHPHRIYDYIIWILTIGLTFASRLHNLAIKEIEIVLLRKVAPQPSSHIILFDAPHVIWLKAGKIHFLDRRLSKYIRAILVSVE